MKYKIIALFGKAGAGKDYIKQLLVDGYKIHGIIPSTTRPPRENEIDGVDYHFLDDQSFGQQVLNNTMLEATCFRDWFYGTSIKDLYEEGINVGIFNIQAIECLLQDSHLIIQPVYITAPDKIRLLRQLKREENPDCLEICRRFSADYKDFLDIPFEYITFNNVDDNIQKLYNVCFDLLKLK